MTHQGSAPDWGTALFFTDFARYMFDGITGYHSLIGRPVLAKNFQKY